MLSIQDRAARLQEIREEINAGFRAKKTENRESEERLRQEQAEIEKYPVAIVTLAYSPSSEMSTLIASLLRSALGEDHLLLDLRIDPSIVAGVVLEYGGKRKDLSLLQLCNTKEWQQMVDEVYRAQKTKN